MIREFIPNCSMLEYVCGNFTDFRKSQMQILFKDVLKGLVSGVYFYTPARAKKLSSRAAVPR